MPENPDPIIDDNFTKSAILLGEKSASQIII